MRNCFVPLCDSKCRDWTRRMMFMAPKDDAVFQQWLERLPQQRRPFRKSDRICERHFDKEDIITTWDHIINGEVHKLERTKPKLKRHAVPMLNLDYTPPLNWLLRKTKETQKVPSAKKAKLDSENEPIEKVEKEHVGGEILNNKLQQNTTPIEPDQTPIESSELIYPAENENGTVVDEEFIPDATLQKFDTLFDDVFEVTLPSTLWGWHRDVNRKFICVSQFSVEFMSSIKMIIVYNNLVTKTFVLDKLIAQTDLVDTDPDNLGAIIDNIDKLKLCTGLLAMERQNCMYILDDEEHDKCGYCRSPQTEVIG